MRLVRQGWLLALAAVCSCGPPEGPNVLLIVSDDLNMALGCYGHEVCRTPNIDKLASQGVRFDAAYAQFPMCGPSRISFLSGLYPIRTRMYYNDRTEGSYRALQRDLAEHPGIGGFLRDEGYFTARVSKIYHMSVPEDIEAGTAGGDDPEAWDRAINVKGPETNSPGELERLAHKMKSLGFAFSRLAVPDESAAEQVDHVATSQAIELLEERAADDSGVPFFLAVGLVRPHVPLVAPERCFELYPDDETRLPDVPEDDLDDVPQVAQFMANSVSHGMNTEEQRKSIAGYYASVTFMDEQVGRLLEALDRLDLRKDTVVIFTSDHGFSLGEHHCWQKSTLFEESARVPLIVSAPGMAASAGKVSPRMVELVDLYPTIADLTGLRSSAPDNLAGASLRPLLEAPGRDDWVKDAAYTWTLAPRSQGVDYAVGESIRTERWRYIRWSPGPFHGAGVVSDGTRGEELYDHQTDPRETHNLASDADHASVLKELQAKLLPR